MPEVPVPEVPGPEVSDPVVEASGSAAAWSVSTLQFNASSCAFGKDACGRTVHPARHMGHDRADFMAADTFA